jgi:hypothetical protein
VISSLNGRTTVAAILSADRTPLAKVAVKATIKYTDRNGLDHAIMPIDGKTDERGVFEADVTGLTWDGTGTITVAYSDKVTGSADFAVLDRTPPKITILPPTTDNHVGPGLPLDISVHVTDEIGVSQVTLDDTGLNGNGNGNGNGGTRTQLLASGTGDATVVFHYTVPQNATGTVQLYALASDLSGNLAAATAVTLTIDPAISIATPPGLTGTLLVDGTQTQLANPRAIAFSSKDGHLYVVDQAGQGACSPSCVWRVDPATGMIDPTPVVVSQGRLEGVAVDADATHLYLTDTQGNQSRVQQLTWSGTAYGAATGCASTQNPRPQNPFHLIVDPTLGILTTDDQGQQVVSVALPCVSTTVGAQFTAQNSFNAPRGIAAGAAGEFYVSDNNGNNNGSVAKVSSAGVVTAFATNINGPYGMEWLAGGASAFKDSLIVAAGDRTVRSTTGAGNAAAVAYVRNNPIDLTFHAGTMYVITTQGQNSRGRLYKVTGF